MFKIGQSYFVEAEDWNFIKPNKSPEQRMGFAIDNAVKRLVKDILHLQTNSDHGIGTWQMELMLILNPFFENLLP